jgi:hypothetical protein
VGKGGAEKKKWFEWSRIHNFTSILIIIGKDAPGYTDFAGYPAGFSTQHSNV